MADDGLELYVSRCKKEENGEYFLEEADLIANPEEPFIQKKVP